MRKHFLSRVAAAGAALALVVGAALLALPRANGQVVNDPELLAQLKRLFPEAASFSAKSGNPPTFRALGTAASGREAPVLGYAFWTTELEPLERGFDGPIKMLVGLNTEGKITGVNNSGTWNGQWSTITIPIPSDYTCDDSNPLGCWLKINYKFAKTINDTTSWNAYLLGDPVRLTQ